MTIAKTLRLESTIHPLTDFLRRSPSRLGRKQECPLLRSNLTRTLVRIPCFMGNPCLSLPPAILRTYPYKKHKMYYKNHFLNIPVFKPLVKASYLPFISKTVSWHFWCHPLFIEWTQFLFIINFNQFLTASGWIWDVELKVINQWCKYSHNK